MVSCADTMGRILTAKSPAMSVTIILPVFRTGNICTIGNDMGFLQLVDIMLTNNIRHYLSTAVFHIIHSFFHRLFWKICGKSKAIPVGTEKTPQLCTQLWSFICLHNTVNQREAGQRKPGRPARRLPGARPCRGRFPPGNPSADPGSDPPGLH